ncbi:MULTISPECIES: DoxX family protein [Nocardiaceae]|uniref:Oxidoreductase n=1 Tax=Rhodococcoides corynebacterioides TaxID=53972 RepID=A0ABS2KPN2_9NOCA|nr:MULTISPECIES: DoxX family protein [Rhodococcus]MBM7413772.1 putative oxidoreductase [Rhodococcus corynebacterioides]MBP1116235.1 putative oxidoreductase [Rhodococcus sp. PvP016]
MKTPVVVRDIAALVARIALGVVFVAHGWQKLRTNGLDATIAGFEGMGIPAPQVSAYFATFVELIGGAALILGVLTSVAALLLVVDMVGALVFVHLDKGVFVGEGGWELVVALGAGALLLAAVGSGTYSVDRAFRRPTSRARATS